ncbi:MAG: NeuD/PglB/VioB family sugar acetyltransferase [Candidatus Omnitrophica bacterium]|nr:NeuD/PglB/VioB family sugar acetyltransferase [Candidatus Omnitrophota bacterium]
MSKKLLLFPFGGSARETLVTIQSCPILSNEWDVVGFVDDDSETKEKQCCGVKVLGGREVFDEYKDTYVLAVPAHPDIYLKRKEIIDNLNIDLKRWATIIHSSCVVSKDAHIGVNTVIMPYSFVSAGVSIGNHCMILSRAVISHDVCVADYCCFGGHVTISGSVKIGEQSYIGSSATIRENVSVGERSLVGMGSNVVTNVGEKRVVAGNPAKEIERTS